MSGYDAYRKTLNRTASTRDSEYRLFGQVTSALIKALDDAAGAEKDPRKMAQLVDALNWNKQIWDVFVEDVGSEGNQLPRELRGAIVSLGIWVNRETAMALEDKGDIDSLIAVNKVIMKGLQPAAKPAASEPAPATTGQAAKTTTDLA